MIVLVDDNDDDRDIVAAALAAVDPELRTAGFNTGAAALAYLSPGGTAADKRHKETKLVLLDLKMPQMDGLQVLTRIRATPAIAGLPVVMCTSSREPHDVARCYLGGANGYLCKPVDFSALAGQMRAVIDFWLRTNEPWA